MCDSESRTAMRLDHVPIDVDPQAGAVGDRNDRPADLEWILRDANRVVLRAEHVAWIFLDLHVRTADDQVRHRRGADVPFEIRADAARHAMRRGKLADF